MIWKTLVYGFVEMIGLGWETTQLDMAPMDRGKRRKNCVWGKIEHDQIVGELRVY